ncbi:MAG: HAD-IIB family hydrolase [Synechococcus sp.]|nr:HAD-IIB family hydrolase [Synechococcus sp.]
MLNQPAGHQGSIWVVTDLDGTLLDHAYDWSAAKPVLSWLKAIGINVVPCTSKTAEEVCRFRDDADLDGPFIVENGGAIHGGIGATAWHRALGSPHGALKVQLQTLSDRIGAPLRALEDLSDQEVTDLTGLNGEAIVMAQRRCWSVPFLNPGANLYSQMEQEAARLNLTVVQGNRMCHLLEAGTSKGQALMALKHQLGQPHVHVMALGDSPNDLPLLEAGDHSVVVPGPDGPHPKLRAAVSSGRFELAPAPHAAGWACSVLHHIKGRVSPDLAATAPEPPHDWL